MPEKYKDVLLGSSCWIALFASMGGCLVRYFEEFKHTGRFNFTWLVADLVTSGFVGYLAFWLLIENTTLTVSQCAVATCLVGNLGSRVFDILRFLICRKLGLDETIATPYRGDENERKGFTQQKSGEHSERR